MYRKMIGSIMSKSMSKKDILTILEYLVVGSAALPDWEWFDGFQRLVDEISWYVEWLQFRLAEFHNFNWSRFHELRNCGASISGLSAKISWLGISFPLYTKQFTCPPLTSSAVSLLQLLYWYSQIFRRSGMHISYLCSILEVLHI
jgi:hypothetical protein